jgi:uncharacterized protein YndB with AHSA1/START domain
MVDIVHRIGIRAPATQAYDAVATPHGIARWWTRDTTHVEPGGGIETRFHAPDGRQVGSMAFDTTVLEPHHAVRWRFTDGPPEWIGTEATFDIADGKGMTILTFGHRGWRESVPFMAHCSMKWATFLWSLRDLLETGAGRPAPDDVKIDDWN